MQEKPLLQDDRIAAHLGREYSLEVKHLEFLPLGADYNSAVYRVVTRESVPYFLKFRKGNFEETSLVVPQFLHERGIRQVIPAYKTMDGRLWTELDSFACILYPFIQGKDGFEVSLSDAQWIHFGSALKDIHNLSLSPAVQDMLSSESYSSRWRERVSSFLEEVVQADYQDSILAEMARFLLAHRDEISFLVHRAGELASNLESMSLQQVLCHSDIHAGNLLLAEDGSLFIVDWDNPILAPKERDLMFIGGGVGSVWNTAREEDLFYKGYASHDLNVTALAYYRYERIVQDIAAFCEQIFLTTEGFADRRQALHYLKSQFLAGEVFEIACETDQKPIQ